MRKELTYVLFLLILFSSCEEYYTPDIDIVGGQLVVDAQITNDPLKNYIHLTKTLDFYNKQHEGEVSGASVELVENNIKIERGTESEPGYFNFNTIPKTGKNYKLRIFYQNDIYESEVVTMPPLPTILSAYSGNKVKREYKVDIFGKMEAHDTQGQDIYIDAPLSDSLSYYRFLTRSILEWVDPSAPSNGWSSYYENANFNIAGPKTFSQRVGIEKHALTWLASDWNYYLPDGYFLLGWILIVDQYGTSKGSFDFHEKLNSQFAADGSLFDPIQTQVNGNITCLTDPAKIVYGYFDLNSYRQYRYYAHINNQEDGTKLRQILRYPYIPDFGEQGSLPDWWEW